MLFFRNKKSLNLFSRSQPQKRSITSLNDFKGMYHCFDADKKHFSPLNGFLFAQLPALNKLYEISEKEQMEFNATSTLVAQLFHKLDSQIRATRNKTNPAFSLSPRLIAQILFHLDKDVLGEPETKQAIINEWKKEHFEATGSLPTMKRMRQILELVVESKNEWSTNPHTPIRMTENILLSNLYYRTSHRMELLDYLQELSALQSAEQKIQVLDVDKFDQADLLAGQSCIDKMRNPEADAKEIFNLNYENILSTLFLETSELPRVADAEYRWKEEDSVPNCVECSFHNLCNILLYDDHTNRFDFSVLPSSLSPHKALKAFYEMQDFKTETLNTRKIGQAFMNLVSDQASIYYLSHRYEIKPGIINFLPVMNFLFGVKAKNLEELSLLFSSENRQISFQEFALPGMEEIRIKIRSKTLVNAVSFCFTSKHCYIMTDIYTQKKINAAHLCTLYKTISMQPDNHLLLLANLHKLGVDIYLKDLKLPATVLNYLRFLTSPVLSEDALSFLPTSTSQTSMP